MSKFKFVISDLNLDIIWLDPIILRSRKQDIILNIIICDIYVDI
jgi:hypothetical protein